jgi:hypothetical protein
VGARNERKLVERLELLLQELEPWEAKLLQCNRRAKMKLMQDVENYKEECRRQEVCLYLARYHCCSSNFLLGTLNDFY